MPLIKIESLTKYYRMGDSIVHALDGVDLEIDHGEFVAITGASGSGKSTMMHLLGCLDRPTGGSYWFEDRNVSELSDRELARIRNKSVGFVFQTFNLINRTSALENVGVPLFYARQAHTRPAAKRALERVGLSDRVTHTPAELSGGERQRVAIARAIVNDPALVLADEPTGNLDSRTGEQIMEIFRTLNEQGVTVILVTHEAEVAMQAKRIVQMRDGKIVLDCATEDLRREQGEAVPTAGPGPTSGPKLPLDPAAPPVVATPIPATGDAPPAATAVPPAMTPRMAAGANGAFGCGLASLVLLATTVVLAVFLAKARADFGPIDYANPPKTFPPTLVFLSLGVTASALLAIISGCIGLFWGRAVLKRVRAVPGAWVGLRRARVGWICGLVTILIPLLLVLASIGTCMLRGPGTQPG